MSTSTKNVSIIIDNKPYQVPRGMTILNAAKRNDIYIPTLCAHEGGSSRSVCASSNRRRLGHLRRSPLPYRGSSEIPETLASTAPPLPRVEHGQRTSHHTLEDDMVVLRIREGKARSFRVPESRLPRNCWVFSIPWFQSSGCRMSRQRRLKR